MNKNPLSALIISCFVGKLRDLPWRKTNDAYLIWLSEIILQQTRVEQGLPYYLKFAAAYPSVKHFAKAPIDDVLKLWQGLGYYSRARNMHFTANYVLTHLNGKFPNTHDELIKLKGIGSYTAAAIASFSNNEHKAVVDGNVYRVLSRIFNINLPIDSAKGKSEFEKIAQELLPIKDGAMHNQAMMEFGALICKPKNPLCELCPVLLYCQAHKEKTIDSLPVKKSKVKIRVRYFYYLHIENEAQQVFVIKRNATNDIWLGLYEFPLIEKHTHCDVNSLEFLSEIKELLQNKGVQITQLSQQMKHVLTHQHIYATFIYIKIKSKIAAQFIAVDDFNNHGVPRVIDKYFQGFKKNV